MEKINMSKKYIAIQDCEYQGKVYRTGEWIIFPDDIEVATLFWKSEDDFNKEREEELKASNSIERMADEEKNAKIKELTKALKNSKKADKEPAKTVDSKDDK